MINLGIIFWMQLIGVKSPKFTLFVHVHHIGSHICMTVCFSCIYFLLYCYKMNS